MFNLKLFIGFALDDMFQQALLRANPKLRTLFTGGGDYLCELFQDEKKYLGKPLPLSTPVPQLENVEAHLLSLLRKLVPDYPYEKNPPVLVACIDDHPCQ